MDEDNRPPARNAEQIQNEMFNYRLTYDNLAERYYLPRYDKIPISEIEAADDLRRTLPPYDIEIAVKAHCLVYPPHTWGDHMKYSARDHHGRQILERLNLFLLSRHMPPLIMPRWRAEPSQLWLVYCCLMYDPNNYTGYRDGGPQGGDNLAPGHFLREFRAVKRVHQNWLYANGFNPEFDPVQLTAWTEIGRVTRLLRKQFWDDSRIDRTHPSPAKARKITAILREITRLKEILRVRIQVISDRMHAWAHHNVLRGRDIHDLERDVTYELVRPRIRAMVSVDPFDPPCRWNLVTQFGPPQNLEPTGVALNNRLPEWEAFVLRGERLQARALVASLPAHFDVGRKDITFLASQKFEGEVRADNPLYTWGRVELDDDALVGLELRRMGVRNIEHYLAMHAHRVLPQNEMIAFVEFAAQHMPAIIDMIDPHGEEEDGDEEGGEEEDGDGDDAPGGAGGGGVPQDQRRPQDEEANIIPDGGAGGAPVDALLRRNAQGQFIGRDIAPPPADRGLPA